MPRNLDGKVNKEAVDMNCEYFCPKKSFAVGEVEKAQIFFANGDFFTLSKKEIADVSVVFYDELRVGERGYCPVAKREYLYA